MSKSTVQRATSETFHSSPRGGSLVAQGVIGLMLLGFQFSANAWLNLAISGLGGGLVLLSLCGEVVPFVSSSIVALAWLTLPPSAVGEQSAVLGTALLATGTVLIVVKTLLSGSRLRMVATLPLLPLIAMCVYWAVVSGREPSESNMAVLQGYLVGFVLLVLLGTTPNHLRDALRVFVAAISAFGYFILLSVPLFLRGSASLVEYSDPTWRLGFLYREWGRYAISNSFGIGDFPRLTMTTGEPGLFAVLVALALLAFPIFFVGKARIAVLAGLLIGMLASQSSGAIIIGVVSVGISLAFTTLRQRRANPSGLLATALVAASTVPLARMLISLKERESSSSLTDRGFTAGSGALIELSGSQAEINLLSAFTLDGAIAIVPLIGLFVVIGLFHRSRVQLAAALFIVFSSIALQPLHFNMAVWEIVGATAIVSAEFHRGSSAAGKLNRDIRERWEREEEPHAV